MKAVFADTFYWIAQTLPRDAAYEWAQQVTDDIVTTEEVLTEYLTFFAEAPEYMRREGAANVAAMLAETEEMSDDPVRRGTSSSSLPT